MTEDAVIAMFQVPLAKYRAFFENAIGKEALASGPDFQSWLNTQNGKTLKEAIEAYHNPSQDKSMADILSEKRFDIISGPDKAFIAAFDKEIAALGYGFGGEIGSGFCWGRYMIIYSKVGAKAKKVAARIYIRDDQIVLRLFLNQIDKHRDYIERAPKHIKRAFLKGQHDCGCKPRKENCRFRKAYTIDGKAIEKCSGGAFEFQQPDLEKLPDYMGLLAKFYPVKKAKA